MKYFESEYELDEYLDKLIEKNASYSRVYNEEAGRDEYEATINLKAIERSRVREEDYDYVFNYLEQKSIKVTGTAYALCGYFDNYKYCEKRKSTDFTKDYGIPVKEINNKMYELYKMPDGEEKQKLRDALIRNNMPFVISIAKKYRYLDLEFEELLNYGYIGLINSIDGYNPDIQKNFAIYAYMIIKRSILSGIADLNNFNDSILYFDLMKKIKELKESDVEYDNYMEEALELITKSKKATNMTAKYYSLNPISLEEIENVADDSSVEDAAVDAVYKETLVEKVKKELDLYDKSNIVSMRYGICQKEKPEKEIAKLFGTSRQTINERKNKTLKKLKKSEVLKKLYNE